MLKQKAISIDLGTNNFATMLDNKSGLAVIIDGRELKSINRFYNKKIATLAERHAKYGRKNSRRKQRMWDKRSRIINEFNNKVVVLASLDSNTGNLDQFYDSDH